MEKFGIKKAASLIGVSVHTLKNWYYWYKSEYWHKSEYDKRDLKLPKLERDEQGRMLFGYGDVEDIKKFKNNLKYGMMAEFNRRYK
jgi:hypothetical protein